MFFDWLFVTKQRTLQIWGRCNWSGQIDNQLGHFNCRHILKPVFAAQLYLLFHHHLFEKYFENKFSNYPLLSINYL